MASAAVQLPPSHSSLLSEKPGASVSEKPHHVQTTLNFFKENEDGSPREPSYVNRPETYDRPVAPLAATIHDISGHELDYKLDTHGFQIYYHESQEKDFLDDEKIKREYYAETEQLLKDAYGTPKPISSIETNAEPAQYRCLPHLHLRPHNPPSTNRRNYRCPSARTRTACARRSIILCL